MTDSDDPIDGRCNAKNRKGKRCRRFPVVGRTRCKYHGGMSLSGKDHPSYKTGRFTKEAMQERKEIRLMLKTLKGLLAEMGN